MRSAEVDQASGSGPPWWAVLSSVAAPVAMIGGWTLAAAIHQRTAPFDPVRETISALAEVGSPAPFAMTAGLALTGVAHLATAAGLGRAGVPATGRVLLGLGGLATAAVAVLPADTASTGHGAAAAVAFVALSVWPAAAVRRRGPVLTAPPWPTRARVGVAASAGLLGLLAWFVLELQEDDRAAALVGLSERLLAGGQSLWPLVVVLALRRRAGVHPA